MRIFTEAQGAFREAGKSGLDALHAAKMMMPVMATYEVAMNTLGGEKHGAHEQAMRNLSKTVETMGGLGDLNRANAITDGVFKAVQSSGKLIDERQLKLFVNYGSSATNQQSLRTIFGGLEPLIGMLQGSSVGVGMRTAYTRMNGMMALPPHLMLSEMSRLKMTDSSGKRQTQELANLQATDFVAYGEEVMRRYKVAGIVSKIERERENAILFGANGSKVVNLLMTQIENGVIHESLKSYDKAKGASDVVNDPQNKALMAQKNFMAKWEDLQLVLAREGGVLDMATKGLGMLADTIERITAFSKENPKFTEYAIGVLAIGGAVLLVGGMFAIAGAALGGLGLTGATLTMATSISAATLKTAALSGALKVGLAAAIGFAIYELGRLFDAMTQLRDANEHVEEANKTRQKIADEVSKRSPEEIAKLAGLDKVQNSPALQDARLKELYAQLGQGKTGAEIDLSGVVVPFPAGGMAQGNGYARPRQESKAPTVTVVNLDGKQIASVISKHTDQANERGMRNFGANPDYTAMPTIPGLTLTGAF
jgi:hypothetical protein